MEMLTRLMAGMLNYLNTPGTPKVTGIRNLVQVEAKKPSWAEYTYTFEAEVNGEWVEYGPDVQGNYTIRRDCPGHTLPESSLLYREKCTRTIAIGFYALDDLYNEMREVNETS